MTFDCRSTRLFLAPQPGPHPSSDEAVGAFAHLESCAECARLFANHRAVAARARAAGSAIKVPASLRDRILANLREHVTPVPIRPARHNLWLAGIAVAASAVLALWLGPPMDLADRSGAQPFVTQALTVTSQDDWVEAATPEPLADWFRNNGIKGFEIPDIEDAQMWRGRVTRVGGQLSAAVDFQFDGKIPFTYIMVPETAIFMGLTGSGIFTMESDEWNVAMWAENGTARAVLSTMDQTDLLVIAQACRDKAAL